MKIKGSNSVYILEKHEYVFAQTLYFFKFVPFSLIPKIIIYRVFRKCHSKTARVNLSDHEEYGLHRIWGSETGISAIAT